MTDSISLIEASRSAGIHVRGLRRTFDSFVAVSEIDLDVPPGQVTALVGPNGAGKTTLLLMLATLLEPDSGTITVGGFDPISEPHQVRRITGWSPDVFGVYDNLTPREYVTFYANAYDVAPQRIAGRVDDLLGLVRLSEFADRQVHVLSRGQKQRLGLTRALVHEPQILMLDEPASGLDPRSRVELRDLLRNLAAAGTAVLVSSHILSDLEEVSDRVVFISNGRTVGQHQMNQLTATRKWRIRALDEDSLVDALEALGAKFERSPKEGVRVALDSDEHAAELIRSLVQRDVAVMGLAPTSGALEATYMKLTGGAQ